MDKQQPSSFQQLEKVRALIFDPLYTLDILTNSGLVDSSLERVPMLPYVISPFPAFAAARGDDLHYKSI